MSQENPGDGKPSPFQGLCPTPARLTHRKPPSDPTSRHHDPCLQLAANISLGDALCSLNLGLSRRGGSFRSRWESAVSALGQRPVEGLVQQGSHVPCHPCSFPGAPSPLRAARTGRHPSRVGWPPAVTSCQLDCNLARRCTSTPCFTFHSSPGWTPARPSERPDRKGGPLGLHAGDREPASEPPLLSCMAQRVPEVSAETGPHTRAVALTSVPFPGPGAQCCQPCVPEGLRASSTRGHPFPRDPAPAHPESGPKVVLLPVLI